MSAFTALVPAVRGRGFNTNTAPTRTRPTRKTRRTNTYRGGRRR